MDAKIYLNTLFSEVDEINQSLLRAYARIYSTINGETLLEFGGGPAVFSLISGAIKFCQEIHFFRLQSWLFSRGITFGKIMKRKVLIGTSVLSIVCMLKKTKNILRR